MTNLPAAVEEHPPLELTDAQREKFLAYVRANPKVGTRMALFHAGVGRPTTWRARTRQKGVPLKKAVKTVVKMVPVTGRQVDQLLASNPDFLDDYLEARGRGREEIRAEIRRRAIDGWDEPVFHNGQEVGAVRKYDSRLLIAMARANLPEYRDLTTVEIGGVGGGPVRVVQVGVQLADVREVLLAAGALPELPEVIDHDDDGDGADDD